MALEAFGEVRTNTRLEKLMAGAVARQQHYAPNKIRKKPPQVRQSKT
jgi:hypothetical protein